MNKVKQITVNILIIAIFVTIVVPIYFIILLLNWISDKLEYYTREGLNKLDHDIRIWLWNKINW